MNIKESTKTYIHYCKDGSNKFDREKFEPIKNRHFFYKPYGGLWGSPVDAEWGWKDWCESEDFRECNEFSSFKFRLKPGNKVLTLSVKDDLNDCPMIIPSGIQTEWHIDFEKLLEMGIDAVELEDSDLFYFDLYSWDCESILVLNPDIIEPVEDDEFDGCDSDDYCYECRGYGDDYRTDEDGELVSECDGCMFNNWDKERS